MYMSSTIHNETDLGNGRSRLVPANAADLLRRHFLNRTDTLPFLASWGTPCRLLTGDSLDALLAAHLQGDLAPPVQVQWVKKDGNSGKENGQFRLGSYSPNRDGRTVYGCIDCDGGG